MAVLSRQQQHQLQRVLRLRDGDEIAVFDGRGSEWVARLRGASAELLRPVEAEVEPRTRLTLFQALIKPARFELVLQKGAELGVSRFVPFLAERSVAAGDRAERWRSIVVEAAEQSGRRIVPDVASVVSFEEALAEAARTGAAYLPWERSESPTLARVHRPAGSVAIIVGPEGGFAEAEVARARSLGIQSISLGRRILRSETAAIAAVTLVLHLQDEL